MDYIRAFDVELDRPVYYAGEMITGHVLIEAEENMRMMNIKVFLRGKAHAEWKITRAGERRAMKQDEHYIDERILLWGKDESDPNQGIPILSRGRHRYPFHFQLPDTPLPCSFESKIGSIRYYIRVNLNIPYASCPQCIRYFTIVGPHIDCMDERFLVPVSSSAKRNSCSLCCGKGPLLLRATLERTSFVCGEQIKLKAEVQNGSDSEVWVLCKVIQYVEFFINKGVLGLSKEVRHTVLEAESDKVPAHDTSRLDELMERLVVPVMPPTMIEVCGLVQIYYTLKLYLETSKGKGDAAEISMPITIATVPYRIPNSPVADIYYEVAAPNVEGGMYISPEFQLGQVYMGDEVDPETDQTILYRPVYVCVSEDRAQSRADSHLLQVPSRQGARSRENVRGSREGLQQQENIVASHVTQQQMRMFQVHDDGKGSSSGKVAKPEDKFLKEITAKIANRQILGQNGEDGAKSGTGDGESHQSEIDAQVERMRKQKQSNDIVHKALVNELRRHLSEGEEGMETEKGLHVMIKGTALKKVSEFPGTADPSKRMKTESSEEHKHSGKGSALTREEMHFTEKHTDGSLEAKESSTTGELSLMKKTETVTSEKEDHEIEYSEHSALLSGSDNNVQMEVEEKRTERRKVPVPSVSDKPSDNEVSMHQSIEEHQQNVDHPQAQAKMTASEVTGITRGGKEDSDILLELDDGQETSTFKVMTGSLQGRIDNITPAALAATVIAAAPVAADPVPSQKACSPKVAPKPKNKDRHSFPAAHPISLDPGTESSVTVRPKSAMVEQLGQAQHDGDSVV